MEQSAFVEWVDKYLPGVTLSITETLNDTKNPLPYFHKQLLTPKFSVDGKWESLNIENSLVSADYVAMDSSLPLKKRDSISKAGGDIPKMGMELWLNEKQLTALDALIATGGLDAEIVAELFRDTKKVLGGAYERNEATFLEALSTGLCVVEDNENVGAGIRLNFGYIADHKFESSVSFDSTPSTVVPFTDFKPLLDKARKDGNAINVAYTDSDTIEQIAASTEAKQYYAFRAGFVGTAIPTPDIEQLNQMVRARYGFVFVPIDRSITREKNGTRTTFKPWAAGQIIFTRAGAVGSLVYAKLAEQNHPVAGVSYQLVDGCILISKYRQNKPAVSEYTSSQARMVPVIANVDAIYTFDSTQDAG